MAFTIATVFKETRNVSTGLQLVSTDNKLMVQAVVDGGLFSSTELRAGMEVININGESMEGKMASYASHKIMSMQGEVWIAAKKSKTPLPEHDDPIIIAATVTDSDAEHKQTAAWKPDDVDPSTQHIERLIPLSLHLLPSEYFPPPGVPAGGVWGEVTYVGPATICLVCAGSVLAIVIGRGCIPTRGMDTTRAYAVGDIVYYENGTVCGRLSSMMPCCSISFTPDKNHLRHVEASKRCMRVRMPAPVTHNQMDRHVVPTATPEIV